MENKACANTRILRMKNRWLARAEDMARYGFGPKAMIQIKVCEGCGKKAAADQNYCKACGKRLPEKTLLLTYQAMHPCCQLCGTVAPDDAEYCPVCGAQLPRRPNESEITAEGDGTNG